MKRVSPSERVLYAVAASLLMHGAAAWVLPERDAPGPVARDGHALAFDVEVPFEPARGLGGALPMMAPRAAQPPEPGGRPTQGALDTAESPARGGTGAAPEEALLLFPFLSDVRLQDTHFNHLEVSQTQRIHTAATRSSFEARRATPNARDAVFLATSDFAAGHRERRTPSPVDARSGSALGDTASERGGESNAPVSEGEVRHGHVTAQAAPASGAARDQTDKGIAGGRGVRASARARVAFARPNVDRGPAATPAVLQGRVHDDTDAELLAARLERSLVDASTQRSQRRAEGLGGDALGSLGVAPSGEGRGAKASPYLPGPGRAGILDTRDGRYVHWFTQQRARVQDRLVFPEARALAKDQGSSLYRVQIHRDGRLLGPPRLLRSSGYSDFDQAARVAIEQAAPFAPLPSALAPEQDRLTVVIPVMFENPMVQ